jgi:uridine kinase
MFLVGIAGGSGSGKTTFANKILQKTKLSTSLPADVVLLHQDSYYLPCPADHLKVNGKANFDHPEAFDWTLLNNHLEQLKQGKSIHVPIYDFRINRRTPDTIEVGPCQTILMEGIFTLWEPELRKLFDLKIFLHVEADIRFIRRLHRDSKERGRSLESIIGQYYDTVRPMYHRFLEPTRQYADLIVGEETDIAADVVAARIQEIVAKERLF